MAKGTNNNKVSVRLAVLLVILALTASACNPAPGGLEGDKSGGVLSGVSQAIAQLQEGDSAVFIFPPNLAYGLPGDGHRVPRRAIIVYELRILNVNN